jgi:hypothetical protein
MALDGTLSSGVRTAAYVAAMRATDEERGLTVGEIWDGGEDAGRRRGLRWISSSYACMQACLK